MNVSRTEYINRVMALYLDAPDTADSPKDSDWPIAGAMHDAGITIEIVEFAFQLTFLRRYLPNLERNGHSSKIHSLAYFRTVINSLTPAERDPAYTAFIAESYAAKRGDPQGYIRRIHQAAASLREKAQDQS